MNANKRMEVSWKQLLVWPDASWQERLWCWYLKHKRYHGRPILFLK